MKKTLLFILSITIAGFIFAQEDCADLFISEVIEGSGNNKAIEIYNPTDHTIDLTEYVIKRYSNGSTTASEGYTTDILGTVESGDVFVLVNGQTESTETSPACDPILQAMADQLDGPYPAPMYANGNDAITLEKKNGTIIDIFGKIGEDPGNGWYDQDSTNYAAGNYWWLAWTKDHTLIRKSEVKYGWPYNPGSVPGLPQFFMVQVQWDSLPKDTWDHLGWHECDCQEISVNDTKVKKQNAYFFPNPVTDNIFTIKATDIINSVEIINMIGQTIYSQENNANRGDINIKLEDVNKGFYLVRVNLADRQTVIKKLLIK
ncbi:MAG: T9SS type A sorting domain-containing protein [Chlorobi bacterium]|nr:T9SS type A sorting domain-containing protein [Chlorobiota bacterium]